MINSNATEPQNIVPHYLHSCDLSLGRVLNLFQDEHWEIAGPPRNPAVLFRLLRNFVGPEAGHEEVRRAAQERAPDFALAMHGEY
jgi:hypothetical protein